MQSLTLSKSEAELCKKNMKPPLCVPTLTAFVAAGKSKEHTDKGKEEKLELLQSFLNTALHFTVRITLYLP